MQRTDGYIPARRAELIAALGAEMGAGTPQGAGFQDLARIVAALLHHEAHEALERLKTLYAPLDPDTPASAADNDAALDAFEAALTKALVRANFAEIETGDERRGRTKLTADLHLVASNDGIKRIRYFARGVHREPVTIKNLFGLIRKSVDADIVEDVVVFVAFKDENEIARRERRAFERVRGGMRPGAVIVKHFRHVARAELITLHPGARPTMKRTDQLMLGVPAVALGVPVLVQLGAAVPVLFAVIAAYLGAQGAIDGDRLKQAIASMSALVAVGGFVLRQKMKFERQSLWYQKELAETVYFRNVANNAGVLDALIGAGEEQDSKEALLAYWALLVANRPLAKQEIDKAAEEFLRRKFRLDVDFEIGDALAKIERMGIVTREGEALRALPIDQSFDRLDAAWDDFFKRTSAPTPAT
ncbi:MAG: DUF3754 domain-containing protein [Hyphomonadaceae bacterium]|nr:DUF3754 domain-containing protein [Hyphomonadaceae bacterium]